MQGTVGRTLQDLFPENYLLPFPGRETEIQKPRPEALHGLPGRMHQILGVETVVPQFVQHDFVGWEVVRPPGIFSADPVDSQKQCALAELVAVGAVFQVPDGRHREYEFLRRILLHHPFQKRHGAFHVKTVADELPSVDFQTVRYGSSALNMPEAKGCAQCDNHFRGLLPHL